ncbi:MAG: HDIG domain-containing protein [Treponema sp.]|nr:HDIG domain-containing protein [Treponema sp.]
MDATERRRLVIGTLRLLEEKGRISLEKNFMQHGRCSVYRHSVAVARTSLAMAERLGIRVDAESLVRGALLHDYFLYDWHTGYPGPPCTHGFTHPFIALRKACEDFALTRRERDIIARHMFPLVPIPPATREGWLVCLADKLCALRETFSGRGGGNGRAYRRCPI